MTVVGMEHYDIDLLGILIHECGHALQAVLLDMGTHATSGGLGIWVTEEMSDLPALFDVDPMDHPTLEGRLHLLYSGWAAERLWLKNEGRSSHQAYRHAENDFARAKVLDPTLKWKNRTLSSIRRNYTCLMALYDYTFEAVVRQLPQLEAAPDSKMQVVSWSEIRNVCIANLTT